MEIHFLVMEKSWKIIVEKEWTPCVTGFDPLQLKFASQVGKL